MELFKILAVCLVSSALVILIGQYRSEYAFISAAAASIVILTVLFKEIKDAVSQLYSLLNVSSDIAYYFKAALKALGIAYITGFTADMCRDFGQSSLASKAELAGRLSIFILSLPLLKALLELALKVAGV